MFVQLDRESGDMLDRASHLRGLNAEQADFLPLVNLVVTEWLAMVARFGDSVVLSPPDGRVEWDAIVLRLTDSVALGEPLVRVDLDDTNARQVRGLNDFLPDTAVKAAIRTTVHVWQRLRAGWEVDIEKGGEVE